MTDVVIHKIVYIQDIPIELTGKALEAGQLHSGAVVGVLVSSLQKMGEQVLIDLKLKRQGQEQLVKYRQVIPIEQSRGVYVMADGWEEYLGNFLPARGTLNEAKNPQLTQEKTTAVERIRPKASSPRL